MAEETQNREFLRERYQLERKVVILEEFKERCNLLTVEKVKISSICIT